MVYTKIRCTVCNDSDVKKHGKQSNGTQRYRCCNNKCLRKTFILKYTQRGKDPQVKKQIIDMAINGSGIRDTSRVLRISQNTVMKEIKKNKVV